MARKAKHPRVPKPPKHPYDIGTHMPCPVDYDVAERGRIGKDAEIVILRADHALNSYTIMDCLTGLVIPDIGLPPFSFAGAG